MKLYTPENVEAFKNALNRCEGAVYLTTPDGSQYNLKSYMSCISGLARLTETDTAELWCDKKKDETHLLKFLHENPNCLDMAIA